MEGFIAGKCSVNIQYARRVHLTADLGYKIVVRVSQKNGNSQGIQGIHTVHTLIKPPRPRLGSGTADGGASGYFTVVYYFMRSNFDSVQLFFWDRS